MSTPGSRATPPDPPGSRPPDPSRFLLVRHGQSTWNDQRRIQGQLDPPLSDLGREQARRLAERLAGTRLAGFYSSDLGRARETAEAIARVLEVRATPMPELREIGLGRWEGLTSAEIADRYPELWARWRDEPSWDIVPGAETTAEFEGRIRSVLAELAERHPQGDVLVVTHGGVIQVALAEVVGAAGRALFPFVIDNCSISTILRGRQRTVITGVNDTSHLLRGAPVVSGRERSGGLAGQY